VNAFDLVIWLAAAVVLYFVGPRVLARFDAWLESRRVAREAERDRTAGLLRDFFKSAPATDREVHGMTVPELMETRERFNEITGREWPDQT